MASFLQTGDDFAVEAPRRAERVAVRMQASLREPSFSKFDVLVSDNNYYIIQELCDGDLERYLVGHKENNVDEKTAIDFLTQICNGFLALIK